jgi:hypothetical protein
MAKNRQKGYVPHDAEGLFFLNTNPLKKNGF